MRGFGVCGGAPPNISPKSLPCQAAIEEEGVMLEAILCTHKHW